MTNSPGNLNDELKKALGSNKFSQAARFALAVISGAIPLGGGLVSAASGAWSESEQNQFKEILGKWLRLQEDEIREIGVTITEVISRLDQNDESVRKRIESPEYLSIVNKAFRDWSAAESEEKRQLIRNLLCNAAGGQKLCSDDVIRQFLGWIDLYSEGHFAVVRTIYKEPEPTRYDIWQAIHGDHVREDSPEADLFKLYIHDLTVGHVIRQRREVDYYGNFLKNRPTKKAKTNKMKSAFDDDKAYELTGLGTWFVHYTMNEMVPRLADS